MHYKTHEYYHGHEIVHGYSSTRDLFVAWVDRDKAEFASDYREDAIGQAKQFIDRFLRTRPDEESAE